MALLLIPSSYIIQAICFQNLRTLNRRLCDILRTLVHVYKDPEKFCQGGGGPDNVFFLVIKKYFTPQMLLEWVVSELLKTPGPPSGSANVMLNLAFVRGNSADIVNIMTPRAGHSLTK